MGRHYLSMSVNISDYKKLVYTTDKQVHQRLPT